MSAGYYRRVLVNESGMIGTQMGTHNRSEIVAVVRTPRAIPPPLSNVTVNKLSTVQLLFPLLLLVINPRTGLQQLSILLFFQPLF
jgi:hypothetical protein